MLLYQIITGPNYKLFSVDI